MSKPLRSRPIHRNRKRGPGDVTAHPIALAAMSTEEAAMFNRFAVRVTGFEVSEPVRFDLRSIALSRAPSDAADLWRLGIAFGDHHAELRLPHAFASDVLGDIAGGLALDDPAAPLFLEAGLSSLIEAAEAVTGARITFGHQGPGAAGGLALKLSGRRDAMSVTVWLIVAPAALSVLAPLMDRLVERCDGPLTPALVSCPVPLALELSRLHVHQTDVANLGVGDVLLAAPQALRLTDDGLTGNVVLRCGNHTLAGYLKNGQVTLKGPGEAKDEGNAMTRQPEPKASTDPDAVEPADPILSVNDIELTVSFEISRAPMSLAAVRRLAEGSVIATSANLAAPVTVRANGIAIGRGSLVVIGNSVGVRIEQVSGDGATQSTPVPSAAKTAPSGQTAPQGAPQQPGGQPPAPQPFAGPMRDTSEAARPAPR